MRLLAAIPLSLTLLTWPAFAAGDLELTYSALELPGAPAQLIPVEIDGDPGPELAVVVVYTAWDNITIEESSEMDDIAGLVAVMTIVPALMENRQLWLFDLGDDGAWRPLTEPLELTSDILSLEAIDHAAVPLLALTDAGAEAIGLGTSAPLALVRELLVDQPPAIAGSRAFLPGMRWTHDLDSDPWPDLLLPRAGGWDIYRGSETGFAAGPSDRLTSPQFDETETPRRLDLPLPEVRDVDGDGLADLVVPHPLDGWQDFWVYVNKGGATFGDPVGPLGRMEPLGEEGEASHDIVFFDDLDNDGKAEYVSQAEIQLDPEAGMRKEMAHAKVPPHRYRIFDAETGTLERAGQRREFVTDGYSFPDDSDVGLPGGLWDLDGDGRKDLLTLTLDFSMLQAVRIAVAHSISLGLDFHILCQQDDGSFRKVTGLDLSGRFKLNLDNFSQGQLSMFDGDFDGDGRKDFVQIGRGREVSIHRGREGCRFPASPDLEIQLKQAPRDLALVSVLDLDGDGLSDLSVVQLQGKGSDGQSAPVRLDLYTSGGGR